MPAEGDGNHCVKIFQLILRAAIMAATKSPVLDQVDQVVKNGRSIRTWCVDTQRPAGVDTP